MHADLNNLDHLLIRCEAINEVVEMIAEFLEREGYPELSQRVAAAFCDAVGE